MAINLLNAKCKMIICPQILRYAQNDELPAIFHLLPSIYQLLHGVHDSF